MTFRELFKQQNGYDVIVANRDKNVYPCPSKFGYEAKNPLICRRMLDCKSCWEREVPQKEPTKWKVEKVQKAADAANSVREEKDVFRHEAICKELNDLYARKNHDYGNSFHASYTEDGLLMAKIRIGDKYNRFKSLIKSDQKVKEESIRDTLIDMANYCIMTVIELDGEQK